MGVNSRGQWETVEVSLGMGVNNRGQGDAVEVSLGMGVNSRSQGETVEVSLGMGVNNRSQGEAVEMSLGMEVNSRGQGDGVEVSLGMGVNSKGQAEAVEVCLGMGVNSKGQEDAVAEEVDHEAVPEPYRGHMDNQSTPSTLDRTLTHLRQNALSTLQLELSKAHEQLKVRDQEVSRLSRIRKEVEAELEELTASLFQEAHNMVREANMRRAYAEKLLKESAMQIEVLTAEVAALKTLVLTSTPSMPNPHLHPQIGALSKKHKRSPSHNSLKYGRVDSALDHDEKPEGCVKQIQSQQADNLELEVDPVLYKEFLSWKQCPIIEKTDPFISRIFQEDIDSCLNFSNKPLTVEVKNAVETGEIFIEAVCEKSKLNFPKKCALQDVIKQCQYRLKVESCDSWHYISLTCRNRIIAVCDFLNYLRYIKRGLVKSSDQDIYGEIIRLRKEIMLARLGLSISN